MPRSCFEPRSDRTRAGGPFVQKPDTPTGIGWAFERPPTQVLDATNDHRAVRPILHQGIMPL
jgi:hypothetical protein